MRAFFVSFLEQSFPFLKYNWIAGFILLLCGVGLAQERAQVVASGPRQLITEALDEGRVTTLKGNTHPLARAQFDLGTAPASLPLQRMLLVLKRSPEQDAALAKLLDDQQEKNSANYHKWMTPEQFGQKFGPADADLETITGWLQSHGFQVRATKGRTVLEFSGSASQVQEAFHTTIHKYIVNGEQHWANASDPQIPAALVPAVAGIMSLNNFPRKAMNAPAGKFVRDKETGRITPLNPLFTFSGGCDQDNNCYALGPYDFAAIYDLLPLWSAGVDGKNQTIAIVGESNINPQDVSDFRTMFGLTAKGYPANNVTVVLNGPDPGIQGDEAEADIDVQWSGAVAPNASIDFVVSQSTETTSGVDLSAVYIVENNLAPVMSESYGYCELGLGSAGNQFFNNLWQQAAAQGITVMLASGDSGAAGCDFYQGVTPEAAEFGLAVSGYASTPYNVAVGGTDFNDISNPALYWNTTNDPVTQASAKGYIPEATWNDSCTNGIIAQFGGSSNPETNCNDSRLSQLVWTVGAGGGASSCTNPSGNTVASCAGGYSKPSWQSGTGVPSDGKRDIPDVSLFASNGFMGNFYVVCESDATYGICSLNSYFLGFGGTSVSSPAFAGIMSLVNQQTGDRQGNANYILYKLAKQQPTAFHDVRSGTIAMPCRNGSPNCTVTTSGHAYGVLSGYTTTAGYDLATGLGSVDANNLVTQWNNVITTLLPSTTTLNSLTPTTITHGQTVNFNVSVKPSSGTGTPTGVISLMGGASDAVGVGGFTLSNGTFSGSTDRLPGGTYSVTAHYPGDGTYGASDSAPISVTVGKENSQEQAYLVTFDGNGNLISSNTTTAAYASPCLLRVEVENSAGKMCAPLSTSGATGCPSGTVMLTDNGSALDSGTYALNSYGYVEDQFVQLSGGSHLLKAAYGGDDSFNASSGTNTITITPVSTTMSQVTVYGASVGQPANLQATVLTTTNAAAPSGTVTFYANGTALTGTVSYSQFNGTAYNKAYTYAELISSSNAFPTPGSYAITATYNGDANYLTSTSAATTVTVLYQVPSMTLTPTQLTLTYGSTATLTALVDTSNKSTYPTGTITFVDSSTRSAVAGPTTCNKTTDASGNFACQAVGTFIVTSGHPITSNYSGDANYPPSSSPYAFINMPDFSMYPQNAVSVTAGQSQNLTLQIVSSQGLSGTVTNFSCAGLPAEATCTFNPAQVTLPSNGSVSTTLTVTTAALGQSHRRISDRNARMWGAGGGMLLLGACFIWVPLLRRRGKVPVTLLLLALMALGPSCGGGGGGGGGGGPQNPVPSISSLTPTQVAAGSQVQSLTINGSNFMSSSTVTYNGVPHSASYFGTTQMTIGLGTNDVGTVGQYPVVVSNPSPGGGPSSATNFAVVNGTPTGSFQVTVSATSGPITRTASVMMYVQ